MRAPAATTSAALRVFVWSRLAICAVAAFTVLAFEGSLAPERVRWDSPRLHDLGRALDVWARWDSDWFLRIAEHGYSWPSSTPAFFPLYPFLVGGLGRVFGGHPVLAGVVVSNVAAAIAFVLLHRLALPRLGAGGARRAVLFLAVFPTSLFLGAVYSEALFLALAVATFVLAERGRLGWSTVVCGLALLTRAQGLALLPALALFGWRAERGRGLRYPAVALAIFSLYPLLLAVSIGRPLAFVSAEGDVWERHLSPLGPLGGVIAAIGDGDVLELAFVALMVPLAVSAWRRFGATYGSYAVVALALPMSFPSDRLGGLYSFPRLCLVAFPCFLALAVLARRPVVERVVAAVLAVTLAVFVVRWSLWHWVA